MIDLIHYINPAQWLKVMEDYQNLKQGELYNNEQIPQKKTSIYFHLDTHKTAVLSEGENLSRQYLLKTDEIIELSKSYLFQYRSEQMENLRNTLRTFQYEKDLPEHQKFNQLIETIDYMMKINPQDWFKALINYGKHLKEKMDRELYDDSSNSSKDKRLFVDGYFDVLLLLKSQDDLLWKKLSIEKILLISKRFLNFNRALGTEEVKTAFDAVSTYYQRSEKEKHRAAVMGIQKLFLSGEVQETAKRLSLLEELEALCHHSLEERSLAFYWLSKKIVDYKKTDISLKSSAKLVFAYERERLNTSIENDIYQFKENPQKFFNKEGEDWISSVISDVEILAPEFNKICESLKKYPVFQNSQMGKLLHIEQKFQQLKSDSYFRNDSEKGPLEEAENLRQQYGKGVAICREFGSFDETVMKNPTYYEDILSLFNHKGDLLSFFNLLNQFKAKAVKALSQNV